MMNDLDMKVLDAIRLVCLFKESAKLYPVICDELELGTNTPGMSRSDRQEALQRLEAAGHIRRGRTINRYYYVPTIKDKDMNAYEAKLKKYLDETASKDKAFAEKYAAKIEKDGGIDKSIKGCGDYIASEVSKNRKRQVWTDPEIYGMALHYYDEGLAAPANTPRYDVVVTNPELTEEDKKRLEIEAKQAVEADYRRKAEQRIKDEAERAEKRRKQAEQKKQEQLEKKRKELEAEATLFSFEEE